MTTKRLPARPISGGTNEGIRPIRFTYWRTGYGSRIFADLEFHIVQAGEYHCKPNYVTSSSEHGEHSQFFYHLAGPATFEYSGWPQAVSSGDILIVPPQQTFSYTGPQEMKYHWFALEGQWPQILGPPEVQILSFGGDAEVEDMFIAMREILILRKPGYPLRAVGIFYELAARLEEISDTSHAPESAYPETVRNAIVYLRENYAAPFNAAKTAAAVGLSPSRLRALFEKWLGESPKRFHTRCRIDQAKRLMSEQNLRIAEVGFHVGFEDVHHFSRVFKQVTGVAPRHYAERKHPPS